MKKFIIIGVINNIIITIISNYISLINFGELDYLIAHYIFIMNCKSLTINYLNFKFSSCLSFNNVICHGIPIFKKIKFTNLKIDISIKKNNFCSDSCYNFSNLNKINYFIKFYLYLLINNIIFFSEIGFYLNIKKYKNIKIIKEFCSHGLYKKIHNELIIYHNINNNKKKIKNFSTFTIEPIISNSNNKEYYFYKIYLNKNNLSYQWEHTMYFIFNKFIITTLRKNEICYLFQ